MHRARFHSRWNVQLTIPSYTYSLPGDVSNKDTITKLIAVRSFLSHGPVQAE